jgi:hypothetical protein
MKPEYRPTDESKSGVSNKSAGVRFVFGVFNGGSLDGVVRPC